MTELRGDRYDFGRYGDRISATISPLLIVAVVTFFIGTILYVGWMEDRNIAADRRASLVKVINDQTPNERKVFAASLLKLHDTELDSPLEADGRHLQQELDELKAAAQTGRQITLDTTQTGWHAYGSRLVPILIGSWLSLLMLTFFCAYASLTDRRSEYLLDLPWKRVWPVFLVMFTVFPIGWPFYIVSAFRTHAARTRAPDEGADFVPHPDFGYHGGDDVDGFVSRTPTQHEPDVFEAKPLEAKIHYVALRSGLLRDYIPRQLARLGSQKDTIEDELRNLGTQIKERQETRNRTVAQIRQLEAISFDEENDPSNQSQLEAEFERLAALPGVAGIRVYNEQISLLVKARVTYKDACYDLGDWELRFGTDSRLYSNRIRSGVRRSWTDGYPDYINSDGTFCFGSRSMTITENLQKGQFLEGIALAINCLHSFNKGDKQNIPRAFKKAEANK